jgi:phosphoglycolate phosphatase-like HAD superfamily hydrolase
MLLTAAREHAIDLKSSVLIGDTTQDVLAGRNAGVKTILVGTGHGGRDPWQYQAEPDAAVADLCAAVEWWLAEHRHD